MADKKGGSLAETMGTAMHLLFQDKIATIKGQPPVDLPTPPPIGAPGSMNLATAANAQEQAKEQQTAKNQMGKNTIAKATGLLFPSASTIGNNSQASALLKIKT